MTRTCRFRARLYAAAQNFDPNGDVFSISRYIALGAGTSFATPMAAGAAALVKQAHPKLYPDADQVGPGECGRAEHNHR